MRPVFDLPHQSAHNKKRRGFALIIALVMMGLVLMLLLSLSTIVNVEVATNQVLKAQSQARMNALMGLDVAIGQLQKYAGPDQRVTFPATTYYPEKNVSDASGPLYEGESESFSNFANNTGVARGTYLSPDGHDDWNVALQDWWNDGRHPHWTGILNSAKRRDSNDVTADQYGEFDRSLLPVWLVSGNENLGFDPENDTSYPNDYLTPEVDLDSYIGGNAAYSEDDIVDMVGTGSAANANSSSDGLDGTVKVLRQRVGAGEGGLDGHYAFWVGDESTKANFAVRDPYYNNSNTSSKEYRNRLQVPQRLGWEQMEGFAGVGPGINDERFERVVSSTQIPLVDEDFADPVKENFHQLTSYSRSLFTDTALGGIKKDLSAYLRNGNGLNNNDPILDSDLYSRNDPRFGDGNSGFPRSDTNIPTWSELRDWSNDVGLDNTVSVQRGRAPIIVNYQIFMGITRDGADIKMRFLPMVALWNPYDATLSSTTYTLSWRHKFTLYQFGVLAEGETDADTADDSDGVEVAGGLLLPLSSVNTSDDYGPYLTYSISTVQNGATIPNYRIAPLDTQNDKGKGPDFDNAGAAYIKYEFTSDFEPGEVRVFAMSDPIDVDADDILSGATSIPLTSSNLDADFPGSYGFPIATINSSALPITGTTRFFGTFLVGNSPAVTSMTLEGNGHDLWENYTVGNVGNWGGNLSQYGSNYSDSRKANDSSRWRTVRDESNWNATSKNVSRYLDDAPIIPMFGGALTPFGKGPSTVYYGGQLVGDGLGKQQRVFANYNITGPSLDLSRDLDGKRYTYNDHNTDDFSYSALIDASSIHATQWDNDQFEVSGDHSKGFALTTWKNENMLGQQAELGMSNMPLRQLGRADSEVLSLGQLQQVNLSPFAWQPAFPIANSEASPYVDREAVAGINSYEVGGTSGGYNGPWGSRGSQKFPNTADNEYIDLSYLLNESLWDRYFLSSIPATNIPIDNSEPLPNSRNRFMTWMDFDEGDVRDMDRAGAFMQNVGALNVNSTSVQAWKALLTAFRDLKIEGDGINPGDTVPVSRTLSPKGEPIELTFSNKNSAQIGGLDASNKRDYSEILKGFRYMDDDMVEALAERIVDEIRLRGPFYSVADFVNRRLVSPDMSGGYWESARRTEGTISGSYDPVVGMSGINGTIQRAINLSGINGGVNYRDYSGNGYDSDDRVFDVLQDPATLSGDYSKAIYGAGGFYLDSEHLAGAPAGEAGQLFDHAPGFISQGDILGMIGPALTARGDTFLVRSYGDVVNPVTGKLEGQAWLEAVVQRTIYPVYPASDNPDDPDYYEPENKQEWGRRFEVVSLRWLNKDDI